MDVNYQRNGAWPRNQANWGEGSATVRAVAGALDDADWRTRILTESRQRIVNRIVDTLRKHLPVSGQGGEREINRIGVRFEEKIYTTATSQHDYLRKLSLKMLVMEKSQNSNAATTGPSAHGSGMTMGATSYEITSGPEDSDEEQAVEEDDGDVSKADVAEEVVVTEEQNYVVGHKENTIVRDQIACGLSSGAKLGERLSQVEERLEKMEAHSEKVETLLVDINEKLNYLVKMQDVKVSKDTKRPAKYMSSSWTGNRRQKSNHRVADMIRQSCKLRQLGKGAITK